MGLLSGLLGGLGSGIGKMFGFKSLGEGMGMPSFGSHSGGLLSHLMDSPRAMNSLPSQSQPPAMMNGVGGFAGGMGDGLIAARQMQAQNTIAPTSVFDPTGQPRMAGPESTMAAPQTTVDQNMIARQNIGKYTSQGLPKTGALQSMITNQVKASGTPVGVDYYTKMAQIESGFNPVARSPTGASGLFQFTRGTWGNYGQGNPLDPVANTDAAIKLTNANYSTLQSRLGRSPANYELYMAHNIGSGGALSLLRADPNQPVTAALIGSKPQWNPKFLTNGKGGTITARQALQNYASAFNSHPTMPTPMGNDLGNLAATGGEF